MISLARTSLFRAGPVLRRVPAARLADRQSPSIIHLQARWASDSKKGSKKTPDDHLLPAMSSGLKEASAVASDIAKSIAGRGKSDPTAVTRELHAGASSEGQALTEDFATITASIAAEVPKPVLYAGLAGALPYVGTSLTTIYYARQAGLAVYGPGSTVSPDVAFAILESMTQIQVTYGAVLLSFLGALHWGMEFAQYGGERGYPRLFLGAAPVVFAWSTLALEPSLALATQWAGFTALWYADLRVTNMGWTPRWYSQYRFYLSILIGTCMIATLAGTNWFGGWLGTPHTQGRNIQETAEHARTLPGPIKGIVGGPIEAVEDPEGRAYTLLRKKAEPEEDAEDVTSGEGATEAPPEEKEERQKEKDQEQDKSSPDEMKQDTKK